MDDKEIRISEVRSWTATLKRDFVYQTARYTKKDIEIAVIQLTDDNGVSGYGVVPSMQLEGETGHSAQVLLHRVLKPIILRKDIVGIQPLMKEMDMQLPQNLQLKFAIEEALLDLQGKQLGVPVYNLIGGLSRREVPVMRILGLKSAKETAEEALRWVEKGYKHIKVKIGVDEKRDVEAIKAVREAVGDKIVLTADANRSYTPMQAIRVINKMEKFKLDGIEQPVGRDDIRGMAFVRQHIGTPLMVDEGVLTPVDAMRLIEANAMDVVCIKLWKVGGFMKAREIASLCRVNGIGCHIGSTPSSQLLEAGQLQFAASIPDLIMGAEIGEFDEFTEDPCSGLEVKNGCLQVSNAPGLGVKVDLSNAREMIL